MFRSFFGAPVRGSLGGGVGQQVRTITRRDRRKRSERFKQVASVLALCGGAYAAVAVAEAVLEYRQPVQAERERVVVLGAGFAALSFASQLDHKRFDVALVAPRAHFLYTPALASAAFGSQELQAIQEPVRALRQRTRRDFSFFEAACESVDFEQQTVTCQPVQRGQEAFTLPYDHLVVAVGARNDTLGVSGVTEHAMFLDSLNDARRLRHRVLDALETAALPAYKDDAAARKALLHFVVVGGSPVARQIATELSDFVSEKVSSEFASLKEDARVSLVASHDHVHNYYDAAISKYYRKRFARSAPHVDTPKWRVTSVSASGVSVLGAEGEAAEVPARVVVWATGRAPSALTQQLIAQLGPAAQRNRFALVTDHSLRVLGAQHVYALGDCATMDQSALVAKWEQLFRDSDVNHDGAIDRDEFAALATEMGRKYPALLEVASRAEELFARGDANADGTLSMAEFAALMRYLDETLTRYPATAATAAQQGSFLADEFNRGAHTQSEESERAPFRYKHIGGYEYVGAEDGLVERGSKGASIVSGVGVWWLWNNVYFSALVGLPMRVKMAAGATLSALFGGQVSKY